MLKFPVVPTGIEPPRRRMNLEAYARFSLRCLHDNPALTAGNCLNRRTDEQFMQPFRLPMRAPSAIQKSD